LLVRVLSKSLPSLEEMKSSERGGLLTLAYHILRIGAVTLPFRVVMRAPSSLVVLFSMRLLVHSLKGDSPSLWRDLGIYLKIGGINPVEVVAGLATYSIREVVLPYLLASISGCYLGALSFLA